MNGQFSPETTNEPDPCGDHPTKVAELRNAWSDASLDRGWAYPRDWWSPAVESVIEASVHGEELNLSCLELARSRADIGVGLQEALSDLFCLFEVTEHAAPPLLLVRAFAEAWAECVENPRSTCTDSLSGLASFEYLRTRLGEVYREASREVRSPRSSHVLVVAELTHLGNGWERLVNVLALGVAMREVFAGGQTLARTGIGTAVGLISREDASRGMPEELMSRLTKAVPGAEAKVWLVELPSTWDAACAYLERAPY